jgi:hypothetical protein
VILGILPPEGLRALGGECAFLGCSPFSCDFKVIATAVKKTVVKIAFLYCLYGDEGNIKVQFRKVIQIAFFSKEMLIKIYIFNKIYRR